jgi:hypothetical protein
LIPIADGPTSYDFYPRAPGLEALGEPADDGVPEPLQFVVNAGVRMILVPCGGFGRTIGDGQVTPPGHHECLLGIGAATESDTDALVVSLRGPRCSNDARQPRLDLQESPLGGPVARR